MGCLGNERMQGSESSSPRSGPQQPPPPPQDTSSSRSTCYLDYAGAGLASPAQLRAVFDSLIPGGKEGSVPVLAAVNPHSSRAAEEEVRRARYIVLSFIGADPGQYEVIFTSGATAAVKLVGEALGASSYRGDTSCCLLYAKNSHTSVVGLRGLFPRGAYCIDGHITSPDCKLVDVTEKHHRSVPSHEEGDPELALIATPGECNFSGAKIDLAATARSVPGVCDRLLPYAARATRCLWLLDIAKLASTSRIDISAQIPEPSLRPHFMCLSFYKIFGYPTGLGALVVRRDAAPLLQRRYVLCNMEADKTLFLSIYLLIYLLCVLNKVLGRRDGGRRGRRQRLLRAAREQCTSTATSGGSGTTTITATRRRPISIILKAAPPERSRRFPRPALRGRHAPLPGHPR